MWCIRLPGNCLFWKLKLEMFLMCESEGKKQTHYKTLLINISPEVKPFLKNVSTFI